MAYIKMGQNKHTAYDETSNKPQNKITAITTSALNSDQKTMPAYASITDTQVSSQLDKVIHIGAEKIRASEILYIEAQEHYVMIRTLAGSSLIRAGFSNVLTQLDDIDGIQTHRSWWVSRRAIKKSKS